MFGHAVNTHIALVFLPLMFSAWFSVTGNSVQAAEHLAANPAQLSVALNTAVPGDRIVMADGIWLDQKIVFKSHGTVEQPITLCAQTPGKVILTGESGLQIGGTHLVVEGLCFKGNPNGPGLSAVVFRVSRDEVASHCRLTQCAIIDYSPPEKSVGTSYVVLYGKHNRVDHCLFRGKTNRSAMLVVNFDPGSPPNHHRIDHNHFADRPPQGFNGAEVIQVGWSAAQQVDSRTIVEFNYFEECNGEVEIITNKSCENIYRHNTFVRCQGALSLRVGHRCTVEGNFFLGHHLPQTGGVHVFGEEHRIINNYFEGLTGTKEELGVPYGEGAAVVLMNGSGLVFAGDPRVLQYPTGGILHPQVKRTLVAFNTFVDCRALVDIGLAFAPFDAVSHLAPSDCVIANNLALGKSNSRLLIFSSEPLNLVSQGNLAWHDSASPVPSQGFLIRDLKLSRDPAGIMRPSPDSPAIGAAVGAFAVTYDIDGQLRPERHPDAGCDQTGNEPGTRRPLTALDVGPDWR